MTTRYAIGTPMRIAQVSYHTNPVAPLGGRHTGGMNVYVRVPSRELARRGRHVDIFTRRDAERPEVTVLAPNLRLVQLAAGPPAPLEKALLVRDAIERGQSAVDFLRGTEVYKRHLGGQPREIVTVRLSRG